MANRTRHKGQIKPTSQPAPYLYQMGSLFRLIRDMVPCGGGFISVLDDDQQLLDWCEYRVRGLLDERRTRSLLQQLGYHPKQAGRDVRDNAPTIIGREIAKLLQVDDQVRAYAAQPY